MHALDGNSPNSRPAISWYRRMLSFPLLHAHFTSGPWRKSCMEFTPHGPTLVTSVFRASKTPFLKPLMDKIRREWLGGLTFSACTGLLLDLCQRRRAEHVQISIFAELAQLARPVLEVRAYRPRLTQFNYFKLHLIGGLWTVKVVHYDGCPMYWTGSSAENACMHLTGTHQTLDLPLAGTGECCPPRFCMPTSPPVLGGSRVRSSLRMVQGRPSSLQGLFTSPIMFACLHSA